MIIGLVSCSLQKAPNANVSAEEAYISRTFRARKMYVEQHCDKWYILSSFYGLIPTTFHVEHYDSWLHEWPKAKRLVWQREAFERLMDYTEQDVLTSVQIHAGRAYYEPLLARLLRERCEVITPTAGMSNLQTFSWLKKELNI
jgi:hypothetical protein